MEKLKAFHGDSKIKDKYVARVLWHKEQDHIAQGVYFENKDGKIKACGVGCTIEGSDHSKYETELGIPRMIARLEDRIFEGLSNKEAKEFPLKFLNAVNVGADLSMVMPKFFVWLLSDPKDGVINFVGKYKKCVKAIKDVSKLYEQTVGGKTITKETWRDAAAAAADAADAYAAYAAYAAAYAAYAADADAAYAAYADAAAAAAAAADAYAAYAADAARKNTRQQHYSKMANKLLELLAEAK